MSVFRNYCCTNGSTNGGLCAVLMAVRWMIDYRNYCCVRDGPNVVNKKEFNASLSKVTILKPLSTNIILKFKNLSEFCMN